MTGWTSYPPVQPGVGQRLTHLRFIPPGLTKRHRRRSASDTSSSTPTPATAYFVIPFTRRLGWYDAVVLLSLFGLYLWRITRETKTEPELIGTAAAIAELAVKRRRTTVVVLFLAAAGIVLIAAEPFANGLIDTGATLGIDRFLLVQWLAPLASEAPELIIATLFAWRLRADDGLTTLLSSKVNQWTMVVGSLPIAYALGGGGRGLHLDPRQQEEFFLTAAQALLGVALLVDLEFSGWEAGLLFGLFALQFPLPNMGVTLAIYAHLLPGDDEDAARRADALFAEP